MKDENKLCFNKTLTYLVLLVAAVVGAFYVMNYANSQKLGSKPRASEAACKVYNKSGNGQLVTGGSATSRFVIQQIGDKCYGLSGRRTTYLKNNYHLAGGKVYDSANNSNKWSEYDGCFMVEIPCVITNYSAKPEKDTSKCPVNVFKWAPKDERTGKTIGEKDKAYYAFNNVCKRNDGYKLVTWVADPSSGDYKQQYRCRLTSQGVSEWNCNQTGTAPTPKVEVKSVPDGVDVVTNNSTGATYTFDAGQDFCPKDLYVWRSHFYGKDVAKQNFTWNGALKGENDFCMKLTGRARVVKNPTTGNTEVRCLSVFASNTNTCNGTKKADGSDYKDN